MNASARPGALDRADEEAMMGSAEVHDSSEVFRIPYRLANPAFQSVDEITIVRLGGRT